MNSYSHWGAAPSDWHLLDLCLGLGQDLLPVVSNPNAKISAQSAMKGVGKTPSRYNGTGEVAGITGWTRQFTTDAQIARWSAEPDYGICLQTRQVRALDVDVDDRGLAVGIRNAIFDAVGELPRRFRENSGKFLLGFRLVGEFSKRILKVDGGAIEFLGNGQQFIAFGTHPSGARYQWLGLEAGDDFPTLTTEQFEALWAALQERFGIAAATEQGNTSRKRGADLGLTDAVVDALHVLGEGPDGQLYIDCPFKDNHSSDTGIGQTCYFPAGSNGYERGHFHCLHAGCQKYTDTDFLVALDLDDRQDDLASLIVSDEEREALPPAAPMLLRDSKGAPLAVPANVKAICERPDIIGVHLRYDVFRDEIVLARDGEGGKPNEWRNLTDHDYTRLRINFDRMGWKPVGRELIRDCVGLVADQNQFDSAITWLEGLEWDGVPRIERFAVDYLGAEDTPYAAALGKYLWTALAGRCLVPGIQMRMAPIFVGKQNIGKSKIIEKMVPGNELHYDVDLRAHDDDNARKMKGRLIGELAELRGLATRDLESIKAFISRTHDTWVPKFKESPTTYGRRIVFVGTSNDDDFLADPTGNTRWLPIHTDITEDRVAAVERDRLQLWAEARELFRQIGMAYKEAGQLALAEHPKFTVTDAWDDLVGAWLDAKDDVGRGKPSQREYLTLLDVAVGALNLDASRFNKGEQMRLSKTMRRLGFEKRVKWSGSISAKVWYKINNIGELA